MINSAILIGRLTRDPEYRTTQSGTPVASFTLAVDRGRRPAVQKEKGGGGQVSKRTYTVCDLCGRHVGYGRREIRDDDMLYIRAMRQWYYNAWPHDHGKSRETLAICAGCQDKIRLLMKVPLGKIAELAGGGLEGDTE